MTDPRLRQKQDTQQDAEHRALLPAGLPRTVTHDGGRTDTRRTPAHVRAIRLELDDDDQAIIRRTLGTTLGKLATSIERVGVRVTDANGPRGGIDQVCRVTVALGGLPSVVIERKHAELHAALDAALRASEQAVRRRLRRRRMKPLRRRHSAIKDVPPW
jgi:putative sigma-54 modulation protein